MRLQEVEELSLLSLLERERERDLRLNFSDNKATLPLTTIF